MTDEDLLWSAIADPSRRRVLDILAVTESATPTALAAKLPFTRQAVSKHLAVLEDAGLVVSHREGREVRYTIQPDGLDAAARALTDAAAQWERRLNTIKRLAEAAHQDQQQDRKDKP